MAARKRRVNPALQAKRDEVRRLHVNATKKISRLKSQGVNLAAHGIDPRVELEKIHRYNAQQLERHAARLQQFNSRSTGFVPGAEGVPIDKAKFQRLKNLTKRFNAKAERRMSERANITLPGQDTTLGQRHNDIKSKRKARGDVYNYPHEPVKLFRSTDIVNIDKLIADMERKNGRKFIPKVLDDQRKQLRQMMEYVGDQHIAERVDKLSNKQFDILFNDAGFADYYARKYTNAKAAETGQGAPGAAQGIEEDADHDINESLDWIENLTTPRRKKS